MESEFNRMLREAIEAGLFPSMEWDGTDWVAYFHEEDKKPHGWAGADKILARAVKRAYFRWKQIHFSEDVD